MIETGSLLFPMQGRAGSRQVTVSAKKIKVGINGFGRIGRNFLRCHELRSAPDVHDAACSAVCMHESPSPLPKKDVMGCMPRCLAGCWQPCSQATPGVWLSYATLALNALCKVCGLLLTGARTPTLRSSR